MNSTQWSLWFVQQRVELHNLLVDCLDKAQDQNTQVVAFYEHDRALSIIARHAQKQKARAELVTVLGERVKRG